MFSFISNVYILMCLLFVLLLVIFVLYQVIRKTWGSDFQSLIITCAGTASVSSFLIGIIDYIFFQSRFLNIDVTSLVVAALIGSVALTYEGLKRYLKYFGIDLERKRKKDGDSGNLENDTKD